MSLFNVLSAALVVLILAAGVVLVIGLQAASAAPLAIEALNPPAR